MVGRIRTGYCLKQDTCKIDMSAELYICQYTLSNCVPPTGFEPVISGMRIRCPGPLDDGGAFRIIPIHKG